MKTFLKIFAISILFFLASCRGFISTPPVLEKAPDTLNASTVTIVPKDTIADLPKGTWLRTDMDEKTEVVLEEDSIAFLKPVQLDPKAQTLEKPQEIVLPKNTHLILSENTYIQTSSPAKVKIEASSEVILPVGTEISITRINWYAILFYCLLSLLVGWYYLQGRNDK